MKLVSKYATDYGMMMQVLKVLELVNHYESKGCSKATAIVLAREELLPSLRRYSIFQWKEIIDIFELNESSAANG